MACILLPPERRGRWSHPETTGWLLPRCGRTGVCAGHAQHPARRTGLTLRAAAAVRATGADADRGLSGGPHVCTGQRCGSVGGTLGGDGGSLRRALAGGQGSLAAHVHSLHAGLCVVPVECVHLTVHGCTARCLCRLTAHPGVAPRRSHAVLGGGARDPARPRAGAALRVLPAQLCQYAGCCRRLHRKAPRQRLVDRLRECGSVERARRLCAGT
mmetsp:Transcript_4524/g.13821  ORF Transcript_4524/g.13821 Transcript_4524/m.13821 type:complete len:214 (+) Transcript_4524:192-833(+)